MLGALQLFQLALLRRVPALDVPLKGPFPAPSNGDCRLCMMRTAKPSEKNPAYPLRSGTLGDAMGDNSHILEHVKRACNPHLVLATCFYLYRTK